MFSAETNNPVVPALTWTHISCTYTASGGRSEIYVNGVLKKEEFTGSGILSQVNNSLFISFSVFTEYHGKEQDCLGRIHVCHMSCRFISTITAIRFANFSGSRLSSLTIVKKQINRMRT